MPEFEVQTLVRTPRKHREKDAMAWSEIRV